MNEQPSCQADLGLLQKLLGYHKLNGLRYYGYGHWCATLQLAIGLDWNIGRRGHLYHLALCVVYVAYRVDFAIKESCCAEYYVPPMYGAYDGQIE